MTMAAKKQTPNPNTPAPSPADQQLSRDQAEAGLHADLKANARLFEQLLGDKDERNRFLAGAFQACRANEDLLMADPASLILALGEAASLKLSVSPHRGESWLIVYKHQVTFRTGYQGLIKLMKRDNPEIVNVTVEVVRRGEHFLWVAGSSPRIEHQIPLEGAVDESDEGILAAYCCVHTAGSPYPYTAVVRRAKLLEARARSGNPFDLTKWSSVWDDHFEAMCKKTAIRRVAKFVPGSDTAREVSNREEAREAGRNVALIEQLAKHFGDLGDRLEAARTSKQSSKGLDGLLDSQQPAIELEQDASTVETK